MHSSPAPGLASRDGERPVVRALQLGFKRSEAVLLQR